MDETRERRRQTNASTVGTVIDWYAMLAGPLGAAALLVTWHVFLIDLFGLDGDSKIYMNAEAAALGMTALLAIVWVLLAYSIGGILRSTLRWLFGLHRPVAAAVTRSDIHPGERAQAATTSEETWFRPERIDEVARRIGEQE